MNTTNKNTILVTGLNGLVGTNFKIHKKDKFEFFSIDINDKQNPVDITDYESLYKFIKKNKAPVMLHLAAFTDVSRANKEYGDKQGIVYKINVLGVKNIIKICKEFNIKLIHMSTAYVFDGKKKDSYIETDKKNPIEWYGYTKAVAEDLITSSDIDWIILRIDQPFSDFEFPKKDIAFKIINGLKNNTLYPQFRDHFFSPTYLKNLSNIIEFFYKSDIKNEIFHATSNEKWSDFEFASFINKTLGFNKHIESSSVYDYIKKANRPYQVNTTLNIQKLLSKIDFELIPIKTGIKNIKKNIKIE